MKMVLEARQMTALQLRHGPVATLRPRDTPCLQTELDIRDNVPPGQKQIFLQHEAHMRIGAADRFVTDQNLTARRLVEAGGHAQDRALAATGGAYHGNEFALVHPETDIVNGNKVLPRSGGELLGDRAKLKRHSREPRMPRPVPCSSPRALR